LNGCSLRAQAKTGKSRNPGEAAHSGQKTKKTQRKKPRRERSVYYCSKIISSTLASKQFTLDQNGQLVSSPAIPISLGEIERLEIKDAKDFADILASLWPNEVLLYGLSDYQHARITTKKRFNPQIQGTIPRSKSHIQYRPLPGILCIDYDPQDGKEPLRHSELLQSLYKACPELNGAPIVLAHSASTYIYNGNNVLKGHKGKRVYVMVHDATDIPRAGMILFQRLFEIGHGWTVTTKNGAILHRSIIDRAMFSPVQIDYAAGAICDSQLIQRRPLPIVINNDAKPWDSQASLPDIANRKSIKTTTDVIKRNIKTKTTKRCKCIIKDTSETGFTRETNITLWESGKVVTLQDIMFNKKTYHGTECVDPVSPTRGSKYGKETPRPAVIFSNSSSPCIHSHEDQGTLYLIPRNWQWKIASGKPMGPQMGFGKKR